MLFPPPPSTPALPTSLPHTSPFFHSPPRPLPPTSALKQYPHLYRPSPNLTRPQVLSPPAMIALKNRFPLRRRYMQPPLPSSPPPLQPPPTVHHLPQPHLQEPRIRGVLRHRTFQRVRNRRVRVQVRCGGGGEWWWWWRCCYFLIRRYWSLRKFLKHSFQDLLALVLVLVFHPPLKAEKKHTL